MGTESYTIGKGKLLFKPSGESSFHDFGNVPDFKVNVEIEKEEHYQSTSGMKTKDWEKVKQLKATLSFTLEELKPTNMLYALVASAIDTDSQSASTAADEAVTADTDRWVALAHRKISSVVVYSKAGSAIDCVPEADDDKVTDVAHGLLNGARVSFSFGEGGGLPTGITAGVLYYVINKADDTFEVSLTSGGSKVDLTSDGTSVKYHVHTLAVITTDYLLNTEEGLIWAVNGSLVISDADGIFVSYSYATEARSRIDAAEKSSNWEGDILFVGDPPAGRIVTIKGYASILPGGEVAMIGDEIIKFNMTGEFLSGHGYNGLFDWYDRSYVS